MYSDGVGGSQSNGMNMYVRTYSDGVGGSQSNGMNVYVRT